MDKLLVNGHTYSDQKCSDFNQKWPYFDEKMSNYTGKQSDFNQNRCLIKIRHHCQNPNRLLIGI